MLLTIDTWDREMLDEKIEPLNKKLKRIGLPQIQIVSLEDKIKEVPNPKAAKDSKNKTIELSYVEAVLNVPSEVPGVEGVTLLARIQDMGGVNLITRIDKSSTVDLSSYQECDFYCSHCGRKRSRKSVWLFEKEGQIHQIGNGCVDEFFGLELLKKLNSIIDLFSGDTFGSCWDDEYGSRMDDSFWMAMHAAASVYLIRTEGFKSRAAETNYNLSTTSLASEVSYHIVRPTEHTPKWKQDPTNAARVAGTLETFNALQPILDEARAYFKAERGTNDFLHNCYAALVTMRPRLSGLVTVALYKYLQHLQENAEVKRFVPYTNAWIGMVGDKLELEGTVEGIYSFEGAYGWTYRLTLRDTDNHKIQWYSSNRFEDNVVAGTKVTIKGTVKKLDEYKDVKATVLTRCKLTIMEEQTV